jgi:hypothetical protein
MSGLKMIDRIIVCIKDGEHRGWDEAARRNLCERKEEIGEEMRELNEAMSTWNMVAVALSRMQEWVGEDC